MGELIVPVDVAGQNVWSKDQKLTLYEVSECNILGRNWKIKSNAAGHYYFRTKAPNLGTAQLLIHKLDQYFLWNALYRLHPMRLIGESKVLVNEHPSTIANVSQPTFTEHLGLPILSMGMSIEEGVTLSGNQEIGRLSLKEPNNSRHQNVARIYLNARFCSDLTASYILYHAALEVLCKSTHEANKNRIQLFLNESLSSEIRNIDPKIISTFIRKRNEIAHDGIQATHENLKLLVDIVKPVLQFELFGEIKESTR